MNTTTAALPSSTPGAGAIQELDLSIGGMTCASCSGRVERALRKVPGVQDATVNLATESARVQVALPEGSDLASMLIALATSAGYEIIIEPSVDAVLQANSVSSPAAAGAATGAGWRCWH